MPSVSESVTSLITQGDTLTKLASLLGCDQDRAANLVGMAAPALLGGVADKAAEPGGIDTINGILDGVEGSTVDDPGAFFERGDASIGSKMVDDIFGHSKMNVVSAMVNQSGVGEPTVTRLLPMLAPVVMGVLNRRRQADNLDGAGMTSLLADETAEPAEKGLLDSRRLVNVGVGAGAVAGSTATGVGTRASEAAGAATGVGTRAREAVAGAATGTAPAGGDSAGEATGKITGKNAGGAVDTGLGTAGGGRRPTLLWWALGGLVAVLALAWALSQCGGADVDAGEADNAGGAIADATGAAEHGADAPGDAVENGAGGVAQGTEGAADGVTGMMDAADVDALQTEVDGVLGATADTTGVSAVVGDDGTVTLTGTVGSEETRAEAEAAVRGVEGVTSVVDNIALETKADGTDQEAEPPTINEELSLDPITFEVLSSTITGEGRAVLDQAAEYLTANPDITVEIAGHTDSDGDEQANLRLSQARAESVKAYLEGRGVDGARMIPMGYGETRPVAPNDTTDGKARNRRIEFVIR